MFSDPSERVDRGACRCNGVAPGIVQVRVGDIAGAVSQEASRPKGVVVMVVRGGASSLTEHSAVLLWFIVVYRLDVVVLVQLVRHAVKDRVPHKCCCSHCQPHEKASLRKSLCQSSIIPLNAAIVPVVLHCHLGRLMAEDQVQENSECPIAPFKLSTIPIP